MTQEEKRLLITKLNNLLKHPDQSYQNSDLIYFNLINSDLKHFQPNFEDPDDKRIVNMIFSCIVLSINNKNMKGGRGAVNNDLFRLSELMFSFNKLKEQVSHFINIEVVFSEPKRSAISYYMYLKVSVLDKTRYLVFNTNGYFENIKQEQFDELNELKNSLAENQIKILPLTIME